MNRDRIPLGLVAVHAGRLLGTVSLIEDDMSIRPAYNPWLGCVYVAPDCRGHGLAGVLIDAATAWAKRLEIAELYVWTSVLSSSFHKRGWQLLEQVDFLGERVDVFKIGLAAKKH